MNEPGSFDGYTLFAPLLYGTTYLIDNDGRLIHSWDTGGGVSAYLLEDGTLIRSSVLDPDPRFTGGGATGGVRQFTWDGTLIWEFEYSTVDYLAHHDIEVLPNGNVLMITWENKTDLEAIAAGRDPALLRDGELHPLQIIEVEPTGATSGNIVWEWHAWDHLIQDFDPTKDNYGVVADHPELIDINYFSSTRPADGESDWHHTNAIDYNEALDQIMVSVRHVDELWVIDHSTTSAEAAGHSGGNSGEGGDLSYRWGNPQAYGRGDASDQKLFSQHDTQWIEPELPGAGNILVFNNGNGRPGGKYSSVDELVPPVDSFGNYSLSPGQAYGPQEQLWIYSGANPIYSFFLSGAVRLPNGNTLVDYGAQGTFFEVTPEGETVWRYVNPVNSTGPVTQGGSTGVNAVFRAYRYAPDYPGLAGRDLTPGGAIEIVDTDGDGLTDWAEVNIHGTDPLNSDTDSDGCVDGAELRPNSEAGAGGGRDPLYYWDFMDMFVAGVRNRQVNIGDWTALIQRFGAMGDPSGDPLDPPTALSGYHVSADRSPSIGPNVWNAGPPDGNINILEITLLVVQFGHSCN